MIIQEEMSVLRAVVIARAEAMARVGDMSGGARKQPTLHKPRTGDLAFTIRMTRKEGRFGMGHDEQNRVVVVHPGSAAEECGLRVGDAVRAVDGVALDGLLTASLAGRERVELSLLRKASEAFETLDLR